jgi:hypothetical protein
MNFPATQKAALESGVKYYFTGRPCKQGHVDKRYAPNACCYTCSREKAKKWWAANPQKRYESNKCRDPEKKRAAAREWGKRNAEGIRERSRKWRAANRDQLLVYKIEWSRKKAGMPSPTRPAPTLCECCGEAPNTRTLHLDHCHITGAFRGWLCMRCNTAIGKLGDQLDGVLRAVRYLERLHATATTTVQS